MKSCELIFTGFFYSKSILHENILHQFTAFLVSIILNQIITNFKEIKYENRIRSHSSSKK